MNFSSKLINNLKRGKSIPNVWATFVILKKVPKVNCHPMSENSPNLVTLMGTPFQWRRPGPNPTILSYNANAVKIYNATGSLLHF
jgi:hypothetical protein